MALRDMRYRRVSPRSLQQSLHLKAIWSIKVFSFDPLTKEQLLDRCPECSRRPTYLRTYGVQYCEFCRTTDEIGVTRGRVDFRDFPQPLIEVNDVEALDFITSLIDPELHENSAPRKDLHPDLREFNRSNLFELAVATACALTCPPSWNCYTLSRRVKHDDFAGFSPEVLARSGRVLLDWPRGFEEIAHVMRASASERMGHYGVRKELAPLVALTIDPHLPDRMRILVREQIRQLTRATVENPTALRAEYRPPSDFVPLRQAARQFAVHVRTIFELIEEGKVHAMRVPDAKKAPISVNARDLKEALELRRSTIGARSVATLLGVPRQFLKTLVDNGSIELLERTNASPGAELYSKKSVEDLKRRCQAMIRDDNPPPGAVRIHRAISQSKLGPGAPWGGIIKRILDGDLEIWASDSKFSIPSCLIRSSCDVRDIPPAEDEIEDDIVLSQWEAALFLGTTKRRVNQLARAGLLPVNPTAGGLRIFSENYVLTPEAIEILAENGIKIQTRDISRILQSHGVQPYAAVNGKLGYVWRRDEFCTLSIRMTESPN